MSDFGRDAASRKTRHGPAGSRVDGLGRFGHLGPVVVGVDVHGRRRRPVRERWAVRVRQRMEGRVGLIRDAIRSEDDVERTQAHEPADGRFDLRLTYPEAVPDPGRLRRSAVVRPALLAHNTFCRASTPVKISPSLSSWPLTSRTWPSHRRLVGVQSSEKTAGLTPKRQQPSGHELLNPRQVWRQRSLFCISVLLFHMALFLTHLLGCPGTLLYFIYRGANN